MGGIITPPVPVLYAKPSTVGTTIYLRPCARSFWFGYQNCPALEWQSAKTGCGPTITNGNAIVSIRPGIG